MINVTFYDVNATTASNITAPDNLSLGDFLSFVGINRPSELEITVNGSQMPLSSTLTSGVTIRALQKASKSGC